ncbi:MAG: phosphate uptake regulator PhoU [bacterium]|nr:phosphate uptake regulator PhoU [bacterium]
MKRKVIQLAAKTLVVSLPSKWAAISNIKKGDEVNIEEQGKRLIISSEGISHTEKISIDVKDMNERVIRWVLAAVHKSGYDEIEILYQKPEVVRLLDEIVKNLFMGFAIIEQTEKRCVLRSVAKDQESEFDAALRRAFLVTLSMGDSVLDYIKKGNMKGLKELINLEKTNNQLTNFCERIINKKGHEDYKKSSFYYITAWNLEKVCDNYKYICDFLSDSDSAIKKEVLTIFERTNKYLRSYYTLFYRFDVKELVALSKEGAAIEDEARKLFRRVSSREAVVVSMLITLVSNAADFSASFFAINSCSQES